jgi:hypothetical protein
MSKMAKILIKEIENIGNKLFLTYRSEDGQ